MAIVASIRTRVSGVPKSVKIPMMFHGTNCDFSEFLDSGLTWFTTRIEDALDYAPAFVFEARLVLANPADLDSKRVKDVLKKIGIPEDDLFELTQRKADVRTALVPLGYDGVFVRRPDLDAKHYGVFWPRQISIVSRRRNISPSG